MEPLEQKTFPTRKNLWLREGSSHRSHDRAFGADLRKADEGALLLPREAMEALVGCLLGTASALWLRARLEPEELASRLGLSRDEVLRKAEELAALLKPHVSPDLLEIPRLRPI